MLINAIPWISIFLKLSLAAPYGPNNHHCSLQRGHTSFTTTVAYPLSSVLSVIGVFQEGDWQGIPIIRTTGAPNEFHAVRDLKFNNLILEEKLTHSHITKESFTQKWYLDNGPVDLSPLLISSYDEKLVVTSICGGSASFVVWLVNSCSSNKTAAAVAFDSIHAGGFATVIKELGGKEFTSC